MFQSPRPSASSHMMIKRGPGASRQPQTNPSLTTSKFQLKRGRSRGTFGFGAQSMGRTTVTAKTAANSASMGTLQVPLNAEQTTELTGYTNQMQMFSKKGLLGKQTSNPGQYKSVNRIGIKSPNTISQVRLASPRSAKKRVAPASLPAEFSSNQAPSQVAGGMPMSNNSSAFQRYEKADSHKNPNLGFERTTSSQFSKQRHYSALPFGSRGRPQIQMASSRPSVPSIASDPVQFPGPAKPELATEPLVRVIRPPQTARPLRKLIPVYSQDGPQSFGGPRNAPEPKSQTKKPRSQTPPKKSFPDSEENAKEIKMLIKKQMADIRRVLNKRRELAIDHRFETVKQIARRVIQRFREREITFQILVANGSTNVNYLDEVMKLINVWVFVDQLKSGRDKKGWPFMRVRIQRANDFLQKFEEKIDYAFKRRVLREAWKRRREYQASIREQSSPIPQIEEELEQEEKSWQPPKFNQNIPRRGIWRRQATLH